MSKQDRQGVRTAMDIEYRYNFGKSFAEVYKLINDVQTATEDAKKAIENLDSQEIFNRLTNYGQYKGIYRDANGEVYVNASYIKSGKLAAEYIDADNLKVKAANVTGTLTAEQIDAAKLEVNAANITGKLTAGQIDATMLEVSAANITGLLTVNQLDVENLWVNAANIKGTLTVDQIELSGVQAEINDAYDLAADAQTHIRALANGTYTGGTFINGRGIIAPVFYASTADGTTYAQYGATALNFYKSGSRKISLQYGSAYGDNAYFANILLGEDSPACIQKQWLSTTGHEFYLGNSDRSCGVAFNFTNDTVTFYGAVDGIEGGGSSFAVFA